MAQDSSYLDDKPVDVPCDRHQPGTQRYQPPRGPTGGSRRGNGHPLLDRYPDALELTRLLRAHAPQLLFLSLASLNSAAAIVRVSEEVAPGLQVIALHGTCEPYVLLEAMRMGIREFIAEPFDPNSLRESLSRGADNLAKRPVGVSMTDMVFSFLPAKPGVGTTTIAAKTPITILSDESRSGSRHE